MIHINFPNNRRPKEEWLARASELTEQLRKEPDKKKRDSIIEENAAFWGQIKEWLGEFSHNKCWFSEAKDTCSYWQVEHFRPKKEARGAAEASGDGYWWLAFDYLNYRLCGGVVNAKKGSFFPLRTDSWRATGPDDECDDEDPVLIDPTRESDVMLLTFAEQGKVVPTAAEKGWDWDRAQASIERYNLNRYPAMVDARKEIWNACVHDANRMEDLMKKENVKSSPSRRAAMKDIAQRLRERTLPEKPFSGVARAFLAQHPRGWARRLIA